MKRLEGKVAIVTGANSGIGKATAELFAREGADLVLAARRLDKLQEVEAYAASQGVRAISVATDVSKPEDCHRLVEAAVEAFGRIDVLVNNAGIDDKNKSITNCDLELWNKVISTDQDSVYYMMKETLPYMEKAGKGSIVNISSISAYTSSTNRGEYCISKAGISMITQLFADELASYGIPVFEVRPGIIATDMTAPVHEKYEKLIDQGVTPIRRFGQPEDVADCVWAACSGLLDFGTGTVLNADGGFHLRRL